MTEDKFNTIKSRDAGLSAEEYAFSYPELTEEQIDILTNGAKDEPSKKSVFSFTKADN